MLISMRNIKCFSVCLISYPSTGKCSVLTMEELNAEKNKRRKVKRKQKVERENKRKRREEKRKKVFLIPVNNGLLKQRLISLQ